MTEDATSGSTPANSRPDDFPELSKQYAAAEVELRWNQQWLDHQLFHGDETAPGMPYAITLPPPNVTGSLHMGHALGSTLQDILIRWERMRDKVAMWMPGSDHAGIATQLVVERQLLAKEGKSRHDLGRDAFIERVWQWKDRYGGRIRDQEKTMGFALDWERERFTLDPGASRAVRHVFAELYRQGLIYRAHRLVNWCPDCFTAVSDLEVNNVDEAGSLWELQYPVVGSAQRLVVATTRPETMLGDTGVAVHPDDERYRHLVGKLVQLPLTGRQIPIVADSFVDPDFGSGAVKVTPAHDFNDFDCGKRCGLDSISIIDGHGKLIEPAPPAYVGMTVEEARAAVVADLRKGGFLGEVRDHTVPRGRCDRSGTVIEPLLSHQWWVRADVLAKPAMEAVERGRTQFVPEMWTKTYMHWMNNIKDWCISRQLWWGHRVPAWYCADCDAITVAVDDPTRCSCGSTALRQDDDVLDTWFSSALWPFSTLGWPEKNAALERFYPNAVLVTAPDIIFFWVARMMMMGLHFMGEVPFSRVFMTPIVTDENGDKMSKVKGNVVDPLHIVRGASLQELLDAAGGHPGATKHIQKNMPKGIVAMGADSLRFSLTALTMPGRGVRISMDRVEGYRHFINKLWNASRFALMNLRDFEFRASNVPSKTNQPELGVVNRWILARLERTAAEVNRAFAEFRFSEAANTLYHFVWGDVCDWYIELSKVALQSADQSPRYHERASTQATLAYVLEQTLRMLHPVIPFVTEEIWHKVPRSSAAKFLLETSYPQDTGVFADADAVRDVELLQDVVVAVRTLRSTYNVPPSMRIELNLAVPDSKQRETLAKNQDFLETLARTQVKISAKNPTFGRSAKSVVGADIELLVPLAGIVDVAAEKTRIEKEIGKLDKEISGTQKKLSNRSFVEKAPADVIEEQKRRLEVESKRRDLLVAALDSLR